MTRYKLVRIINGRYFSANTPDNPIEYVLGETVTVEGLGVACYKRLEDVDKWDHLDETLNSFNKGKPIAILHVKSIGRALRSLPLGYRRGEVYEGGINYQTIKVESVVKKITKQQIAELE